MVNFIKRLFQKPKPKHEEKCECADCKALKQEKK